MEPGTSRSPPQRTTPLVNQSISYQLRKKKSGDALIGLGISFIGLAILLFDLNKKRCPEDVFSYWQIIEFGASIVLALSLFHYVVSFLYYKFCNFYFVLKGTNSQRKLLNFDEKSFIVDNPAVKEETLSETYNITNLNLSYPNDISLNSANSSVHQNRVFNTSNISQSFNGTYSLNNSEQSANFSNAFQTPNKNSSLKKNEISDKLELQAYLTGFAEQERNIATALNTQSNTGFNTSNSFWSPNIKQHGVFEDMAVFLKTTLYQLSPMQSKPSKDEMVYSSTKSGFTPTDSEESKKISAKLSNFVANLRMWISSTILNRLVFEINKIDETLQQRSLGDFKIGEVGLEKLKKVSEQQQLVSQMVPQLPTLIPFLDLTCNQEYLVKRIKELAKGSCMAAYKWNSGSMDTTYNDDEHIPTDSAIIFHLFCTYLDSQLWRSPEYQRPFYDRYVLVGQGPKEIKNKSKCAILCSSPMKPKYFNFISDGKIQKFSQDSRNSLFYAIIQFLIFMKENANGALEGVQLGRSGINIMCVVEEQ